MDKTIFQAAIARSNAWKEVILRVLQENDDATGLFDLRDQLAAMFENDSFCIGDVDMFKKLKREHVLPVSIQLPEFRRLPEVVKLTFKMCEDILKWLPTTIMTDVDESTLSKHKQLFEQRGEQVVYSVTRTLNMTLVDVVVRTDEVQCDDLLYWSKDKLFIMTFVSEIDDDVLQRGCLL